MFVDAQNLFDDASEHLTTEASDNLIDLSEERRIGTGETLYIVAQIDTAMTDAGSDSTMTLTLESDALAAFGSATERATIGVFAATAAAGARLIMAIPPDVLMESFIRVKYTVANGNLSTGNFTVFITKDIQAYQSYPDAITIS